MFKGSYSYKETCYYSVKPIRVNKRNFCMQIVQLSDGIVPMFFPNTL